MENAVISRMEPTRAIAPAEAPISGVSWPAVLAGAFVAAGLSLVLMALGAGMGLSSLSPWPQAGANASRVAPVAVFWIILVQSLACALGGYVAGRLRTKWVAVHDHEVYFRDTAHGLLVWAVGLVISVAFLSGLATSVAGDAAEVASDSNPSTYFVDTLFRGAAPSADAGDPAVRTEAGLILARALRDTAMVPADRTYLASLIATRTGLTPEDAAARVDSTTTAARQAIDTARKAVAHSLYWLVVALLAGAFFGSFAATIGGRQRDRVRT